MNIGHLDYGPILYGVIIFLGIWSMFSKFQKRRYRALFIEVAVFLLVFRLHGGSMAGGFAATVSALLAGFLIPPMFGRKLIP